MTAPNNPFRGLVTILPQDDAMPALLDHDTDQVTHLPVVIHH